MKILEMPYKLHTVKTLLEGRSLKDIQKKENFIWNSEGQIKAKSEQLNCTQSVLLIHSTVSSQ
jgi:hypothetical protein